MSAGHKVVVTSTLKSSSGLGRKESGVIVPGVRRGLPFQIAERSPGYQECPLSVFQAEYRHLIFTPFIEETTLHN